MAELNRLGIFISVFIALIVGVILVGVIADDVNENTQTDSTTNESFVALDNTFVALANDDLVSVSEVRNFTQDVLVLTTDYTVDLPGGRINISTIEFNPTNTTYYADYVYERDLFVSNATARTLLNLIPLFFVLGIAFAGIVLFRKDFL